MTTTNRDQLIRAALMPSADLVVPADLGEQIHERLVGTPQQGPGLGRFAGPFRRFVPEAPLVPRPNLVWVTALLLLLLAIAILGVASQRQSPPFEMTTYHGGPTQDGIMPGPGPAGAATVLHEIELDGPMNNFTVPLVRDGIVYFADTRGNVSALDAVDLTSIWTVGDLAQGIASPVLLGPRLIVAGSDGTVAGLDPATGDVRWSKSLLVPVEASLTGSDDRVLVSCSDGNVHVHATSDGQLIGTLPAHGPVDRSPAIAAGVVYVAADSGVVTAFDLETLEERWSLDLAADDPAPLNEPEVSTPAYANGTLYLVRGPLDQSVPHEVVAIDVTTQHVRWRSSSPTPDRLFVGAVTNEAVYTVGEDGAIRRLDAATGAITPFYDNSAGMGALPTIVGDTLYVSSYDGMVRAIDLATGVERWHVQLQGLPTMPVVIDGRVYVGTDVGHAVVIGSG